MSSARFTFLRGARLAAMAVLAATALAVVPAWANPLVDSWTYTFTSQFDTSATVIDSNDSNCSKTNTTTRIAWGCPQGTKQSSLELNPASTSSNEVTTNGSADDPGVTLIHHNYVIDLGTTLDTAVLGSTLKFTSPNDGGSPYSHDFNINFQETPNSKPCAAADDSESPCADIFVITGGAFSQNFSYDGNFYHVSFGLNGITGLSDDECDAAGVSNGCRGFITQEGEDNKLGFSVLVTGQQGGGTPVPEPNALGMMGFGLFSILGLLFLRRRRTAEGKAD